jgi:hypothetical protein
MMKMAEMTTAQVAEEFETTPRVLRKVLRSEASGIESVGKGARYTLPGTKRELTKLRKQFDEWTASKAKTDETVGEDASDEIEDELDA